MLCTKCRSPVHPKDVVRHVKQHGFTGSGMYSIVQSMNAIPVSKLLSSALSAGLPLRVVALRRCTHCNALLSHQANSRRHSDESHSDKASSFRMEDAYLLATRPEHLVAIRSNTTHAGLPEWQQEVQDWYDTYMSSASCTSATPTDDKAHAAVVRATGWPAILDTKLETVTGLELQR